MRRSLNTLVHVARNVHPGWLLISGVLVATWNTPILFPLKLFVVFLHELSHAVAAIVTGGKVVEFQISSLEGGLTLTQGGSRFVILSAGYLGSLFWGGCIMLLSARTHWDRRLTLIIGSITVVLTLLYIRNIFGMFFGISFGAALVAAGFYLPLGVNDAILRVIGFTSCVYAILDIKSDILEQTSAISDAAMLAELTGVPTMLWGLFWSLGALIGTFVFLYLCGPRRQPVK